MLETKIDKLTKAIEALTAVIEAQGVTVEQPKVEQPKVEQPKAEQPKVEQPKVEQPKVEQPITHDEVKQLCLQISRDDRSKKPAIKTLLGEYGANTVLQVAAESLAELKTKLGGLQ